MGAKQRRKVLLWLNGTLQDGRQVEHPGAALGVVLEVRWPGQGVAKVLLRQPQQPIARRMHFSVESLDCENLLRTKTQDGSAGYRNAEFLEDGQAKPLVLYRRAEVYAAMAREPQRQLQDVAGWRRAMRKHPSALVPKDSVANRAASRSRMG